MAARNVSKLFVKKKKKGFEIPLQRVMNTYWLWELWESILYYEFLRFGVYSFHNFFFWSCWLRRTYLFVLFCFYRIYLTFSLSQILQVWLNHWTYYFILPQSLGTTYLLFFFLVNIEDANALERLVKIGWKRDVTMSK